MRYARWYPTQISLPGNKIFIYAGWDRDEKNPASNSATSATGLYNANTQAMTPFITAEDANPADQIYDDPPIPPTAWLAGNLKSGGDTAFGNSRVKIPVPEVYDGLTDTTIALENMRLFHGAWYPNGLVIQTGTGRDDWKVAANDGNWFPAMSGGVNNATSDRTFHNSFIYDVQAALKDPNRNTPPCRRSRSRKWYAYLRERNEVCDQGRRFHQQPHFLHRKQPARSFWMPRATFSRTS